MSVTKSEVTGAIAAGNHTLQEISEFLGRDEDSVHTTILSMQLSGEVIQQPQNHYQLA